MRILILGGTGAMGVPLVRILADAGHDVFVTSRGKHDSNSEQVEYIQGNAKDDEFLKKVLCDNHYDAIVDFMHYSSTAFQQRMNFLLSSTDHYLFFSSCRVFAPSDEPLTENSARLLDTETDAKFLSTDEYALAKARCENSLRNSGHTNYTIIRPYITYNTERIQLGMFEKEAWLYRVLNGRSIVFGEDMLHKKTTLTYAGDVAKILKIILEKNSVLGQAVNIVDSQTVTWGGIKHICAYCRANSWSQT